eukprot:9294474-Pyramimonas_sp.AAC.1
MEALLGVMHGGQYMGATIDGSSAWGHYAHAPFSPPPPPQTLIRKSGVLRYHSTHSAIINIAVSLAAHTLNYVFRLTPPGHVHQIIEPRAPMAAIPPIPRGHGPVNKYVSQHGHQTVISCNLGGAIQWCKICGAIYAMCASWSNLCGAI